MADLPAMPPEHLPEGIRSRFADNINGLRMHILEAGFESPERPALLLLHGFPELAYSWRKIMPTLAERGYHVIAADHRGYGRTTGADTRYDGDLNQFRILNLVRDQLSMLAALGHTSAAAVIGHDFGSAVASACALARPDVFKSMILMSAPCPPVPALAQAVIPSAGKATNNAEKTRITGLHDPRLETALSQLKPPRKHYQWYYSTPQANHDMLHCEQGLHAFLRAYYHHKSADWKDNNPRPLADWSAAEMGQLPTYYVMEKACDMAATVRPHMPSAEAIAACRWLTDDELSIYTAEYQRTGFQGGLQAYRITTSGLYAHELTLYAGRSIDVPAAFISGKSDWGMHQKPGALEAMQSNSCSDYRGTFLVDNAGHWVQQEQPQVVADHILEFMSQL